MVAAGQLSDARGPRPGRWSPAWSLFVAGLLAGRHGDHDGPARRSAASVQGLGGGLLITAIYVLIGETYPEQLRPKVFVATSRRVGAAVAGRPAACPGCSTQHVELALGVPRAACRSSLIGGALLVPGAAHACTAAPATATRLADPRRLLLALVVAAGVAAFEARRPAPVRRSTARARASAGSALASWGCAGCCRPAPSRVRAGVGSDVALRGLHRRRVLRHRVGRPADAQPAARPRPDRGRACRSRCPGSSWAIGCVVAGPRPRRRDAGRRRAPARAATCARASPACASRSC